MRNSSVPAEMIWPLVTLRLMIRPETGARMVAWLRRVWVSDRDAWAEARLAAEARWLASDVSSEAWLRKPFSFSCWARDRAASSRDLFASAVWT
jgi:hypothetical protein